MTRERIRLEDRAVKMSVKTVGKEKVGVLDIPGFYVGLTDDVKVQPQKLEKQNVSSVIIDLRSNGGGALTEAVSLSGLFIPSARLFRSVITTVKFVKTAIPTDRSSIKARWWYWLTVSVLRLQKSLPRQCRDYGRALVVGEPTFGKGTVQQYRSLNRIYDQMLRPEFTSAGICAVHDPEILSR